MEEDLMAMSLLYALLDIHNREELDDQATRSALKSSSRPADKNKKLAVNYYESGLKQKKEVRKALYDALYHMLEYASVNRTQSMAIGKVLCNALRQDPEPDLRSDPDIENLYKNLRLTVTEAIEETSASTELI
jgi:hypothetical protein